MGLLVILSNRRRVQVPATDIPPAGLKVMVILQVNPTAMGNVRPMVMEMGIHPEGQMEMVTAMEMATDIHPEDPMETDNVLPTATATVIHREGQTETETDNVLLTATATVIHQEGLTETETETDSGPQVLNLLSTYQILIRGDRRKKRRDTLGKGPTFLLRMDRVVHKVQQMGILTGGLVQAELPFKELMDKDLLEVIQAEVKDLDLSQVTKVLLPKNSELLNGF